MVLHQWSWGASSTRRLNMASKKGLEYDVRGVNVGTDGSWEAAHLEIKEACEDMDKSGWTLSSMSWPTPDHVVLVFTRPKG